jgi:hypothetical protein
MFFALALLWNPMKHWIQNIDLKKISIQPNGWFVGPPLNDSKVITRQNLIVISFL